MKISEIKQVIGKQLEVTEESDFDIRHLLTDSRQLGNEHSFLPSRQLRTTEQNTFPNSKQKASRHS